MIQNLVIELEVILLKEVLYMNNITLYLALHLILKSTWKIIGASTENIPLLRFFFPFFQFSDDLS